MRRLSTLLIVIAFCCLPAPASAELITIEFNAWPVPLPLNSLGQVPGSCDRYSEDGARVEFGSPVGAADFICNQDMAGTLGIQDDPYLRLNTFFLPGVSVFLPGSLVQLDLSFFGPPGSYVRFLGGQSPIELSSSFNGLLSFAAYGWTDITFFRISTNNQSDVIVDNIQFQTAAIPEPSALILFGIGAFGLLLARRRSNVGKNV